MMTKKNTNGKMNSAWQVEGAAEGEGMWRMGGGEKAGEESKKKNLTEDASSHRT